MRAAVKGEPKGEPKGAVKGEARDAPKAGPKSAVPPVATVALSVVPTVDPTVVPRDGLKGDLSADLTAPPRPVAIAAQAPSVRVPALVIAHPCAAGMNAPDAPSASARGASPVTMDHGTPNGTAGAVLKTPANPRAKRRAWVLSPPAT